VKYDLVWENIQKRTCANLSVKGLLSGCTWEEGCAGGGGSGRVTELNGPLI